MFTRLKINAALLICTAFVFRLLFVNVGLGSLQGEGKNNRAINNYFSSVMKRKKNLDIVSAQTSRENSTMEVSEGNLNDEDDLSKTNPLILIRIIYSFFENKMASLASNMLFDPPHSKLSSKKYLAVSVLRI